MAVKETQLLLSNSVGTPVSPADANYATGCTVVVHNTSAVVVYFGDSTVSATSCALAAGEKAAFDIQAGDSIYFRAASTTPTIPVLLLGV